MIWQAERIGRNGVSVWKSDPLEIVDRFEFLQWVRACCHAAGFADRARRQVDLPSVWAESCYGDTFAVRNYSALGDIDSLRFTRRPESYVAIPSDCLVEFASYII